MYLNQFFQAFMECLRRFIKLIGSLTRWQNLEEQYISICSEVVCVVRDSCSCVDVAAGILLIFPPFFFYAWKKNRTPVAGIRTRVSERS